MRCPCVLPEIRLDDALPYMRTADSLLYRHDRNPLRIAIAHSGRGEWSHAGMFEDAGDGPHVCDVTFKGGGRRSLVDDVREYPGLIEWFEADSDNRWPEFNREGAIARMRQFFGCTYGWWSITRIAMRHFPLVNLFLPIPSDTAYEKYPPVCSEAVSISYRDGGGVDPVSYLADRLTEPDDLAHSLFLRSRGLLIP
jgi:hypothetical protein